MAAGSPQTFGVAPKTSGAAPADRAEREHPRYAHEAAITVHIGKKRLAGRTENVSRGGLCADLRDSVPAGTEVDVDMQLVFAEDTQSEPLRLQARVAWCTTLDETFQVGLAFKPLDIERNEFLTMFLRYLDDGGAPKLPKRQPSIDDRFG